MGLRKDLAWITSRSCSPRWKERIVVDSRRRQHPSLRRGHPQPVSRSRPAGMVGRATFRDCLAGLSLLARLLRIPSDRHQPHGSSSTSLTLEEAIGTGAELARPTVVRIVQPTEKHWQFFREMLTAGKATANLVTDAHLAALALEHGCELILDRRGFRPLSQAGVAESARTVRRVAVARQSRVDADLHAAWDDRRRRWGRSAAKSASGMTAGASAGAVSAGFGRSRPDAARIAPQRRPANWANIDRTPEADDALAGHQRGVARQRADPTVGRGPAPEEPLGVAAAAEGRPLTHRGGVHPRNTRRLQHATEAGLPQGQRRVDPRRQRVGRMRREAAHRLEGRFAVEGGQNVGAAQIRPALAQCGGRCPLIEPPGGALGAVSQAGRDDLPRLAGERARRRPRRPPRRRGSAGWRPPPSPAKPPRRSSARGRPPPGWPRSPRFRHSASAAPGAASREPHLAGQPVRVVVRLGVDHQNLAVGRAVFQNGNQGVVQLRRITQKGYDDRQSGHSEAL